MAASRSSYPPVSGAHPVAPPSLASLAIALAGCDHPESARVSAQVHAKGSTARIAWCAHCGAMSSSEVEGAWQRPALALLVAAKHHLQELSQALHALKDCHAALVREEGGASSRPPMPEAELRAALAAVAQTALYRDLERFDRGIAAAGHTDPPIL